MLKKYIYILIILLLAFTVKAAYAYDPVTGEGDERQSSTVEKKSLKLLSLFTRLITVLKRGLQ